MSIPDPSPKSDQTNSPSTPSATSSQGSRAGQKHSNSQTCHPTPPSGQDHVPASRSAQPGSRKAPQTSATSGPSSETSSPSAALQQSLASKLRQKLEGRGSPLYDLKWKNWDMPSGPAICALRASVRRTSAKDSGSEQSGWLTPTANDDASGNPGAKMQMMLPAQAKLAGWPTPDASAMNDGETLESFQARQAVLKAKHGNGNGAGMPIAIAAQLAGWPTPRVQDSKHGAPTQYEMEKRWEKHPQLHMAASLAGWGTPLSQHANGTPEDFLRRKRQSMERGSQSMGVCLSDLNMQVQAWAADSPLRLTHTGELLTGSSAEMESGGQLNPEHSRWLMGYPEEWGFCGATAMQSSPRSRRSSSKRSSNPPQL